MNLAYSRLFRRLWYVAAGIIILLALLVTTSRLMTPYFNDHLPNFQQLASDLLEAPVTIKKVSFDWDVYEPELTFDDVNFIDAKTQKPHFQIHQVKINLSLFRSLFARKFLVEEIKINGVDITVHQPTKTRFDIEGVASIDITDKLTGSSVKLQEMLNWISSVKKIYFTNINIQLVHAQGEDKHFTVNSLTLKNSLFSHSINGNVILNQEFPTSLHLNINWKGDIKDLSVSSANLYIYLEGVDLIQWIEQLSWKDLQVTKGVGSAKIWANWDNKNWTKLQTSFQLYSLELKSLLTQQTQLIPRISGNLGWKKIGKRQVFAGDQLFIDLPHHLWPITSFVVESNIDKDNKPYFPTVKFGYVDINDAKQFIIKSGFLPKEIQDKLIILNPTGEINDFQLSQKDSNLSLENLGLSTVFTNISFDVYEKFPSIKNMSGAIIWKNNNGDITLQSSKAVVAYPKIFANEIALDQFITSLNIKKAGPWVLEIKDLFAKNKDMQAQGHMNLIIPENASPEVDLKADFNVTNASNITKYLPLAIFEAPLTNWLKQAFHNGFAENGKVILNGKLSDFPFEAGNGKFLISSDVKNVDLDYAPKWPTLKKASGKLIFSGRSMQVDIDTAQFFNIPLKNIHADIPYLGADHPQILNVGARIHTDIKNALNYVLQSPLRETLGKDLAEMNATGPVQLKLNLAIPLRTPGDTKVTGDMNILNAHLDFPVWKLTIDQLQGLFHFTEKGIQANNLNANVFGHPAVIEVSTQHPENQMSYLQISLTSAMDVSVMQNWAGVMLGKYVSGTAPYSAELHLYSKNTGRPTELTLHSDLKGITLTLPEPFLKKPEETRDFQVTLLMREDQFRTKLTYAKIASAAFAFANEKNGIRFVGGELSLGGDATWQNEPGLLISAEFKKLNWENIKVLAASKKSSLDTSLLRGINLNIAEFDIFGQIFRSMRARLEKNKENWFVYINSPEINGQLIVPQNRKMIQARFERITIPFLGDKPGKAFNFKGIPEIVFIGHEVRIANKYLGTLRLELAPMGDNLLIKNLQINSDLVSLNATGEWSSNKARNFSHLSGNLTTNKISEFLNQWGFSSKDFVASKADATFNLSWPDSPFSPTVNGMSGTVSLNIGKGSIINLSESNEAKIGLSRLLNFLSLGNLSRQMSLNVNEYANKGFTFDFIKGDFELRDGNAYTENLSLDGPIAKVALSGRIGLSAKDLNILMTISPYVSTSLPAVAAATAINPFAGVALWAVGGAVSQASYRYNVTGPWENPHWNQASGASQ